MSHTKTAITCVMALTADSDRGPEWVRLLVSVIQFGCLAYLLWYVWRGPDAVDAKTSRTESA